jgi:hypothetical protein
MHPEEVPDWAASVAALCARFDDLFARSASRAQARKYLRGWLAGLERQTRWPLAEGVKDGTPDRRQRLLYRVPWDAEAARDRWPEFVIERLGDPEAIAVLEETGIPKQGIRSVGVQKQSCGAVGKLENCQVATVLTSATARGHVFLDRRWFLPEDGCGDRGRRARARVPEAVRLQTQPQPARALLEHARQPGVPLRSRDGRPRLWRLPRRTRRHSSARVVVRPRAELRDAVRARATPARRSAGGDGGRPRRAVRLAPDVPKARTVAEVSARRPRARWKRRSVGIGPQGPRISAWTRVRVIERRAGFPGPEVWLLARRSVSAPTERAYYFALAPNTIALQRLATVAGTRYTVEQVITEAQRAVGCDR